MMDLNKLKKLYNKEHIDIVNWKMNKNKARILQGGVVFVDYSQIDNEIEEKELLAEELGHYYYDAYYNYNSSSSLIKKAEYKANKWKSLNLVTLQDLLSCKEKGINDIPHIAYELQVSPASVQFSYDYYRSQNEIT